MRTVCELNQCAGCQVCVNVCAKNAISIQDNIRAYNAEIDEALCINCGMCEKMCPVKHPVHKVNPISWSQGWALDEDIRQKASSGGIATALHEHFVREGGVVCSCAFSGGEFVFDFAVDAESIRKFTGSKYVKSNPKGVYPKIKRLLNDGKKVLFLGLPCQCAAVKQYTNNHDLLYTVDLICHGTPSPKTLEMFLKEKGYNFESIHNIAFREKTNFHLFVENKGVEPRNVRDRYIMAFLKSLCYTENCYSCRYADTARVSDITLGDSWGSTLDAAEQNKGISLVLCQTAKGKKLLEEAKVHLESVDIETAIANNKQLMHPSPKNESFELFHETLLEKKSFSKAVGKCYPKACFRQKVKALLIKLGLIHGN